MILVTGSTGFIGKRVCAKLRDRGRPYTMTAHEDADLCFAHTCRELFAAVRPSSVIHCASFSGGIGFNERHQAEIFRNNLLIGSNVLEACAQARVRRLVSPIANCAYPGRATLFREAEFWDGPVHDSVLSYGFTRKAMVVGAEAYRKQHGLDTISVVLSNSYGPGDHLDEVRAHALGALVVKMINAQKTSAPTVTVWGTGTPVREWLYVDDAAEALVRALDCKPHEGIVNVGTERGVSVRDLANMIRDAVGYEGVLEFDATRPDGAPMKTVEGSKGRELFGWGPEVEIEDGIRRTVAWAREALS